MTNRNIFTASIVLLLLGIAVDGLWQPQHPSSLLYLANLLPGSILMVVWVFASLVPRLLQLRSIILGLGTIIAILAILLVGCFNLLEAMFVSTVRPVTDIAQYEATLQREDETWLAHFPTHIPDSATHVAFCYRPAFLQGGMSFRLRYQTSTAEIEALLQRYIAVARQVQKDKVLPLVPCQLGETENVTIDLPPDTQFLILYANVRVDRNHGGRSGIALSLAQQTVLYWAEYW